MFDKKNSPREIAKKITDKVSKEHHLGSMSIEVLEQEIFSLKNTNPMFRDLDWQKKFEKITKIVNEIEKNPRQKQGLTNRLMALNRNES